MSVVGIDLGAQSTKIGVARNKGIDIVRIAPRTQCGFATFSG
jgi:heat shock protein 4